ncbi:MAG: PAS domain-containing protein, partial [Candidatus Eremiobacteraeota bacterium]|nr:PAS domain-containing protein [Candidatus Eremiobacteraeota bacterium]
MILRPALLAAYMPHGMCYLWNPALMLLHIASDALIALAYFSIPALLLYLVRARKDIPLRGPLAMFAAFIVACGMTHVLDIYTIWQPVYWLAGGIKAITAIVSVATAIVLFPLIPKLLTYRSVADLERANSKLEKRFQSLIEAIPQMVWTATGSGEVDYFSSHWLAFTGKPLSELKGWGWESIVHADDLPACLTAWTAALAHGTPYEAEHRLRAKDGVYRWFLGRALPIADENGSIAHWFG